MDAGRATVGRSAVRRTTVRRTVAGLAAVAMAVLLAACADAPGEPEETPSPSPPATPTVTPTPPMPTPAPPGTPVPPMPSPSPGAEQTITGLLIEGVEPGCVLLRTDTGAEYLLLGEQVDELRLESTVTVRGYADPGAVTTCMQGVPFHVQEVVSR